jgi:hypothetical protein
MLFGTKSVDSKAEKRPFLSHKTNNISHFVGSDPTGKFHKKLLALGLTEEDIAQTPATVMAVLKCFYRRGYSDTSSDSRHYRRNFPRQK